MSRPQPDVLQGTLDLLILSALSLDAMHGWGVAQRIPARRAARAQPMSALRTD